jgi:uncharacterized protein
MPRMFVRLIPHAAFAFLLGAVVFLAWRINGVPFPTSGPDSVWFYSGFVMLLFAMFYVEPHYGAPKNAMMHAIAVILVALSVRDALVTIPLAMLWWRILVVYATGVLFLSWLAGNIGEPDAAPDHWANRSSEILKNISVLLGEARVMYSGVFLLFLPTFHRVDQPWPLAALGLWWLVVMTNPQKQLASALDTLRVRRSEIAKITGVQSSHVFLARLYPDTPVVQPLDSVEFTYAVDRDPSPLKRGVVLTSQLLEEEKWIKVLELESSAPQDGRRRPNAIYRVARPTDGKIKDMLDRFLGVVVERSEIGVVRFEIIPGSPAIAEGEIVEVPIGKDRVFYQIVNAQTGKETLEAQNEGGFIRAEAVQLGRWNSLDRSFEKFGWLPDMTAPVFKAKMDVDAGAPGHPELLLGVLPGTDVPFFIDLDKARSHHMAVLGVTGAGKSFITFEIIRGMMIDTKVICVDFTAEYMERLAVCGPQRLIDAEGLPEVEAKMAEKADAQAARGQKAVVLELKRKIERKLTEYVEGFIESEHNLAVFELPDLSNTSFILEFTQMFLEAVFHYAKSHPGKRICLVIEEAHTVIPEATSLGDLGDFGSNKALVNKIGQIALQGRKYGVGFLVIAQRTANVSKTVLTQCNSLICFQAFDDTSYRFIENHLGSEMVKALPRLRQYHAIAVGKAFRGNIPMIVDLTRPAEDIASEGQGLPLGGEEAAVVGPFLASGLEDEITTSR